MRIKESKGDTIFYIVMVIIALTTILITVYPMIYTVSCAFSEPQYVVTKQVVFLPKGFSLEAFKFVLRNRDVYLGFMISVIYSGVAVLFNTTLTILLAYPLSRRYFSLRKQLTVFVVMTMFFSAGMIPNFLLVTNLGLYDTRWAMILPSALSVYNVIITRSYIENNIHESLIESARIDGANDFYILFKVVVPLSKPIIAVLVLFVAVDKWNSYMDALMYLPSQELQPIQLYLRRVMLLMSEEGMNESDAGPASMISYQIKYVVAIIAMVPIMCVYPFLQKYFAKGISLGGVKE